MSSSVVDPDPYSRALCIRIRIRNTDPDIDPNIYIYYKIEAKDVEQDIKSPFRDSNDLKVLAGAIIFL